MDEFHSGNVYGYSIEPTSPKGVHRYIDFYSLLPEHIRRRDDLMKIVYMFQDYLNDGYRKIPEPTVTHTYKTKRETECGSQFSTHSYSEITRPLNHNPAMYKEALKYALDYSNVGEAKIEEYDKERDIETWSIDDQDLVEYKGNSKPILGGGSRYSYYNEPKVYNTVFDFYRKYNTVTSKYLNIIGLDTNLNSRVYIYLSQPSKAGYVGEYPLSSIGLDESSMTINELVALIPVVLDLPKIEFTYYACDVKSFVESGLGDSGLFKFKLESRKVPFYYGISDYSDYNGVPEIASTPFFEHYHTFTELVAELQDDIKYDRSFRVTFAVVDSNDNIMRSSSATVFDALSTVTTGDFAMKVWPESTADAALFALSGCRCIASSLNVILEYQHPEFFFEKFGWQNEYRHESKKASIAEKIYRLAYSKDPNVFDYEYMSVIAQHFGYAIETDEEEVNQNSYYKTKEEKEMVLRKVISNMPEFNRMKGTDSGIEMVLLSFGLVGRVINLFTRGDELIDGYASFVDSRLISGDIEDYMEATNTIPSNPNATPEEIQDEITAKMAEQFNTNAQLTGTSIYDWYASPHFRIEFDVLKDFLSVSRSSDQFSTISKTIKRIKPINTVFQGFYAKMTAEYGNLFLNPPTILNKVKQTLTYDYSCEFVDEWTTQCALELNNEN